MRLAIWALALAGFLVIESGATQASTAADRLLRIAKAAKPVPLPEIKKEVSSLLADLGASGTFGERFALMGEWHATVAGKALHMDDVDHRVIIASGSVSLTRAFYTVVITTGNVHVQSGAGLLVVSGGNITFGQSPEREWAGVFVTRGTITAPWLARAALHARGGANVRSNSIDVLAYNTDLRGGPTARLELRSGKPLFSGDPMAKKPPVAPTFQPAFPFAGERCEASVPLAQIADRVPKMAREKTKCSELDLILVTCGQDVRGTHEVWTVHACQNEMVDIRARLVAGASQLTFVPPPAAPAGVAVAVPPKLDRPLQCEPGDFSVLCVHARLQRGEPAVPTPAEPQPAKCAPPRPPGQTVDQLLSSYDRMGVGFAPSSLPGPQVASHFALARSLAISRIEWSGLVQHAEPEEKFIIRIFRDANGQPGSLVHEAKVTAQTRPAPARGYRGRGHPFLFASTLAPIELQAGHYWISVIDPKPSGMDFMWGMEDGPIGSWCGSGGARRQGEKGPWAPQYVTVPQRTSRGFSFRLE